LETAAQVARDAAAIQDLERLLAETVRLISDRFGFYHAGIFLLDEGKEYAVLRAASSPGGQRMLERGHRLEVGETSIVGYVTYRGMPRIALDVGDDAVFFDNPDLPDTRSEIALPLQVRDEIIGALDVQRRVPGAFGEEDIAVLQTLADLVAVAISNARLFRQAQAGLEAERRAYGELSRQAWAELVRHRDERVYRGRRGVVTVLSGEDDMPAADDLPTIDVPVRVRGQVVATIQARKPDVSSEWASNESEIVAALADQLGQALESARLYQDTQRRAAQEQLLGQVSTRMRETLDVDAVLKAAAQEMHQALGLSRMTVRLVSQPDGPDAGDREDVS
jgi:GAF domain-containing protein